jgi:hypothetical protein
MSGEGNEDLSCSLSILSSKTAPLKVDLSLKRLMTVVEGDRWGINVREQRVSPRIQEI